MGRVITLPWSTADPRADISCTVIAGRLPVRSVRDLPAVLAWTRRVRRQLATAPGLAGHGAALDLSGLTLWTVSAWTTRTDLTRFERGEPHQAAESSLRARLWPATFAVWTCATADLPLAWTEIRRRVEVAPRSH